MRRWTGGSRRSPRDRRPAFTPPRTPRAHLALRGLRGRPVDLVFHPIDWEPGSREQLALHQDYPGDFDRFGARLPGISVDHVVSHEAFAW